MTGKELEKIYNEAYRAVYWTSFSLLKDEDEAQDVVQDTFVALINSYDSIRDKSKVLPWLKKVAANRSLNRLTRTKTDTADEEFFDTVETVPEDFLPDSLAESDETRKILMDIIDNSLSEDIRRTLILFYFDEMSTREIAEALGIPEGTVSWRINSAKKKIKKEVEKYEEENDTKLYMVIPFLTKLFTKEAEQVPIRPMPASLLNLSASAKAAATKAAGSKLATKAITKGTGIIMKKLIIGISAAVVSAGLVTGEIVYVVNHKGGGKEETRESKIENEIESVDTAAGESSKSSLDPAGSEPAGIIDPGIDTTSTSTKVKVITEKSVFMAMDGMTADEIVENIWKTADVYVGMTEEEYDDRLIFPEGELVFGEVDFFWGNCNNTGSSAYIDSVSIYTPFDNKVITSIGDSATVDITLKIMDEELMHEVFNKALQRYLDDGYIISSENDSPDYGHSILLINDTGMVSILKGGVTIILHIPIEG